MVVLTNVNTTYDAIDAARGLGLALVDFTGKTQCLFVISVKKVGTGTQSWQLWNETDGQEIGVINDSAAAGPAKLLNATFAVALTGVKIIRIRAKSTVSADDPIFFGGTVYLT